MCKIACKCIVNENENEKTRNEKNSELHSQNDDAAAILIVHYLHIWVEVYVNAENKLNFRGSRRGR